jgi:tRNA A-37 threonylcarbamoyl transferase component Bud32
MIVQQSSLQPEPYQQQDFNQLLLANRGVALSSIKEFFSQPDNWLDESTLIKDGDTTTVALVVLQNVPLVLKRYNMVSVWHRLKRSIQPSRAMRCWHNALRLRALGIHTPKPVAVFERRWGPLRGTAYLLTDYIVGTRVSRYLAANPELEQTNKIVRAFKQLFTQLLKANICHGDTKADNFIWTDQQQLWAVDLDGMRYIANNKVFVQRFSKDLNRFIRNWQSKPEVLNEFLPHIEILKQQLKDKLKK